MGLVLVFVRQRMILVTTATISWTRFRPSSTGSEAGLLRDSCSFSLGVRGQLSAFVDDGLRAGARAPVQLPKHGAPGPFEGQCDRGLGMVGSRVDVEHASLGELGRDGAPHLAAVAKPFGPDSNGHHFELRTEPSQSESSSAFDALSEDRVCNFFIDDDRELHARIPDEEGPQPSRDGLRALKGVE